nr:sigma 54-interacting transcriptional regulator [Acidobacteriota bacterium]
VLARGLRVLQGRERHDEGSACALQLGWLALERGDPATAQARFEMARELAGESPRSVLASVGAGTALVDADRLVEAEAMLRGALVSAETLQDADGQTSATAALVRCLYWQKRPHDAIAMVALHPPGLGGAAPRARLLAAYARCLARAGRTADAVRTARESQVLANAADDPGAMASIELALAETLIAAGDVDGARVPMSRAMGMARSSHLPLVRIRALLLQASAGGDMRRDLRSLGRVHLPPLLGVRLSSALSSPHAPVQRRLEPVAQLEVLLRLSQQAEDDATALARICAAVLERLAAAAVAVVAPDDRLLCLEGRSWPVVSTITKEAFAGGATIPVEGRREPQEAAEPVRFGGELVAVLGCRWTAGTAVDRIESGGMMRAAALAAAPHVRAILDRRLPEPPAPWADLLGESASAVALRESVVRAARAPFPVLIEGESGSGKELVARAVHRLGPRRDRRFCALNCAALTDDLVEAELFGHARGAFTGAATERAGLFEEADGGTLFLDEIGELSPRAQAKLLRVLQEGEVRRVGENMPRHVDVRIVAATNRRLADEVVAGRFRADLRFRLDVVRMTVPPLRERASDVPLLAVHFWRDASARVGSQATLAPEALAALARYDWPGNVRELQNVIAWIAVQSPRRGRVGPSALPRHVAQAAVSTRCTFEAAREDFERRFIRAALAGANGQRARAAEAIGVTRQGLAKMIRRLRLGDDEKTA